MGEVDILGDRGMKDLVQEYEGVEEETSREPEVSLEASPVEDPVETALEDGEPSRELPDTREEEETPVAEAVAADTPAVDDLTQQLTDLAKMYSVPTELLAGQFSSVEDAKAALSLLDQSFVADAQSFMGSDQAEGEEQSQQAPAEPPQAAPEPPVKKTWADLSLDNWDEDDDLPKNLKGLDKNTQILAEQITQMQDAILGLSDQRSRENYNEVMGRLNSVIDKEESKLFGSGDSLTPTQEKNRLQVLEQADYLVAGMHSRGVKLPSEDQLIERAMFLAFKTELGKERALGRATKSRPRSRRLGTPSRGTDKSVTDMAMQHSGPLEENQAFLDLYKRLEDET